MIQIQIENNLAYVDVEEDGRTFQKVATLDDVRKAIGIKDLDYDSGLLPGRYGTKRIADNQKKEKILYTTPPQRRTVYYTYRWTPDYDDPHGYTEEDFEEIGYSREGRTYEEYDTFMRENWGEVLEDLERHHQTRQHPRAYDVMVPTGVLFVTKEKGSNIGRAQLFSTGGASFVSMNQPLYRFPFPNIYGRSGEICWQDFETTMQIEDIRKVEGVLPTFLSTFFNRDLAGGRLDNVMSIQAFWEEMDEAFQEGKSESEVLEMYDGKYIKERNTASEVWDTN